MIAEARPAASLILLRRGGKHAERGIQVLLVRRTHEARFMPGVWVFPGGRVDADDAGDEDTAHMACAVRELHEEAGIELPPDAELLPWSRWITPEPVPTRFDTRFYVALAPPHSPPRPPPPPPPPPAAAAGGGGGGGGFPPPPPPPPPPPAPRPPPLSPK